MHTHYFDHLTRSAVDAGVRRRPLLTLAGVAVAASALRAPRVAAGKDAKKVRKRAKRRSKKKCKRQIDECRAVFTNLCASSTVCEQIELDQQLACCEKLANCHAGDALDCFFTLVVT